MQAVVALALEDRRLCKVNRMLHIKVSLVLVIAISSFSDDIMASNPEEEVRVSFGSDHL